MIQHRTAQAVLCRRFVVSISSSSLSSSPFPLSVRVRAFAASPLPKQDPHPVNTARRGVYWIVLGVASLAPVVLWCHGVSEEELSEGVGRVRARQNGLGKRPLTGKGRKEEREGEE